VAKIKKQVGIWIRVSTEDQARGDSPEHHEQRARAYAEMKGWQVAKVYRFEGVSGKLVADHPKTTQMRQDVAEGAISGLIFSKLARLARNTKHLLEFADYFQEHDADLISLQESIDTSTPAGRLFYTMIAAMAEWEREEIAERVKASVPIRAKLGKPLGGKAPFGYQWVDKQLIPNPEEAPIRKRVFELFREHRRKSTVADAMNEAGFRTRSGGLFTGILVNRLLTDPVAKGLRRANYTKTSDGSGVVQLKPESEWVWTEVEPIVDPELWDECNAIILAQKASRKPAPKKTTHLFSGLLFCSCGKKMYVRAQSKKYFCRGCTLKIAMDDLEEIVVSQLKSFLLSPDEVGNYLKQADEARAERESAVKLLAAERSRVVAEIKSLFELHHTSKLAAEDFKEYYDPLKARQQGLEEEMAEAQAAVDLLNTDTLSSAHIYEQGQSIADRWPTLTRGEKRRVIEDLVEEIEVGKEEVAVRLLYFPVTEFGDLSSPSLLKDACKGELTPARLSATAPRGSKRWTPRGCCTAAASGGLAATSGPRRWPSARAPGGSRRHATGSCRCRWGWTGPWAGGGSCRRRRSAIIDAPG